MAIGQNLGEYFSRLRENPQKGMSQNPEFLRREFGSDLLGGISVLTSLWLGEYLAGSIIVLMLSGGAALESYALRSTDEALRSA